MPRPSNTETRRQQIVDGLLQVMSQKSYEKATIASIARAAELTPGVVHYHFNSKQEILLELTRQLAEKLSERYHSLTLDGSPRARLNAFIDARLATGPGSDPAAVACWVAIGTEASRQEEVGDIYRRVMGEQVKELSQILESFFSSPPQVKEAAVAILAAIEGCYQVATAAPELAPDGFASRSVKAMAAGLIGA
ncbi:MAG: TetR family transcriptional regulator C-terminal domain-containing protein [Candidatus Eremiobacteraeota bacterium]|nr:TetR family transcriptional regulator C-terminal domain-containing protein [Candidatus Eremiobacteraeota bacterium]